MIMAENKDAQIKKLKSLCELFNIVRQSYHLRKQSSMWFAPILSFSFPSQQLKIKNDLQKQQYQQLLNMFNYLASDIFLFYKKEINVNLYQLLAVIKTVFGLSDPDEFQLPGLTPFSGYYQLMSQIHLSNTLALFMVKHKQYSVAFQYFDFIINVIQQQKIDIYEDIFLTAVSNYLCLLQMHTVNRLPAKSRQLVQMLQNIYQGMLNKFLRKGYVQNSLLTLLSVFKQNQIHLGARFQLQTKLLFKKLNDTKQVNERKTSYLQSFLSMNKPYRVGKINSRPIQMKLLAPSIFNKEREKRLHRSTELKDYNKTINQNYSTLRNFQTIQLNARTGSKRIGRLNDQFINTSTIDFETIGRNRFRIAAQKQDKPIISQKKPSQQPQKKQQQKKQQLQIKKDQIKKIQTPIKKQEKKQQIKIKKQRFYDKNEALSFKINYSKIQINNEGIILMDFVQERKKFVTWSQVYQILQNVRFSLLFNDFLPICCYYDVARILSFYLYRAHSDDIWGAAILDIPKQIAQINMVTKLYKDEGPYLKALFLNVYDVTHVDFWINCYLADMEQYFKCTNNNQYIQKLNKRILRKKQENQQRYLSLEHWKRKKQGTSQRIIKLQFVRIIQNDISYLRLSLFKIMLLLPKNKQILLYINEKDLRQTQQRNPYVIPITVVDIQDPNKKENKLNIPIYKISRFFPLEPFNLIGWVKRYGKFIVEGYLTCFGNYPQSFYNMQYFNVITYAKKIEITNQGKYKTPVIAQLIGTKSRIWGISIRFYEQFNIRQVSTFIINPYYELLSPLIKLSPNERRNILIDHLFEGSVSATYKKLLQKDVVGKTINIIDYWNMIQY